jgi:hypothetical protein
MDKWWRGLTSAQKLTVSIFLIIIIWIVIRAYKGVITGFGESVNRKTELAALSTQGIKPTYRDQDYKQFADRLEYAMDGMGTYTSIIDKVYNYMKNDADMIKLKGAFGVREGSDLPAWIRGDLSTAYISEINRSLQSRGITKRINR